MQHSIVAPGYNFLIVLLILFRSRPYRVLRELKGLLEDSEVSDNTKEMIIKRVKNLEQRAENEIESAEWTNVIRQSILEELQKQKATLFQGETLRGLLLGEGYAFWTFGMIAFYASIAALVGAGVVAILVLFGVSRLARLK